MILRIPVHCINFEISCLDKLGYGGRTYFVTFYREVFNSGGICNQGISVKLVCLLNCPFKALEVLQFVIYSLYRPPESSLLFRTTL